MVRKGLVVLLVLSSLLVFLPSRVNAQENCDVLVLDSVDGVDVFGSDTFKVEEAARSLQDRVGAVVYVRAINTYKPQPNLDQYFAEVALPACGAWQQTNGKAKNNLVVVMASFRENEREIGVYFGSEFRPALDSTWRNEVAAEEILPRFRDGEFVAGYVDGLTRIEEIVATYENPPANSGGSSGSGSGSSGSSGDTTNIDAGPIATVFGIGIGVFALFALLILAYIFLSRWRKGVAARKAAQQKALNARNQVNRHLNSARDVIGQYKTLAESVAGQVDQATGDKLLQDFAQAQTAIDTVLAGIEGQSSAFDPTREKLTLEEYENIEGSYNELLPDAQEALRLANVAQGNFQSLRDLIVQAPANLVKAKQDLELAQSKIGALEKVGFRVADPKSRLEKASELLTLAEKNIADNNFGLAIKPIETVSSTIAEAVEIANQLVETKQRLDQAVATLLARIQTTQGSLSSVREVFDYLVANYSPETYKNVSGNGTESEKRIARAASAVEKANAAVSMSTQDWEGAENQIQVAQKALEQVDSMLHSITALRENLDRAKADAPAEIASAEGDLMRAADFIAANKADVAGNYRDDFGKARDLVSTAKRELEQQQPNYLVVVKSAKQANSVADEILSEARSEVEKAERVRQAAASALRDASMSVSKLEEYIQDHDSDVGQGAENDLTRASSLLAQAQNVSDPEQVIALATEAEQEADSGYSKAERDFERAEDEREQERRLRQQQRRDNDLGSWGSGGAFGGFGGGHSGGHSGGISIGGGSIGFGGGGGGHGGGSIKW